ncbi:RNA polymerase recycling motor ATPase HelR [Gordonia sp. ABSL1-1]|uniref:RNA polymerase recycling motor ATPase HelR n=1 Tax=Gordonia sp. ABSL1-1 TaxID=3053923 RepID=UPI0025743850|nr:RNA polymerase recycling motor ATPase HelR [Gordonia sp. ABSL1-1]MDL9935257.1 RNA polymerase recycling motor ATPase HelR [Gordonia sp. ABSL1-1]
MPAAATSIFDLARPVDGSPTPKAADALITEDEKFFATLSAALDDAVSTLTARIGHLREMPGGRGKQAVERDLEIHLATTRLRTLERHRIDLCLGRMVTATGEIVYIGRIGIVDAGGTQLLVDWRTPAAEPFFAATHADPRGLASRRRYRWAHARIVDYWDEELSATADRSGLALDDDSAFLSTLADHRSARMRDVLATIAADQDAIIRAGSAGALVVDGGPGTGKTVVALHRAAYLAYADPRLAGHRGAVLVVGPHRPYLSYVADVLPSLGEESVRTCTLDDLVPEGAGIADEADPALARLKSSSRFAAAVNVGIDWYEEPPTDPFIVETPWADVELGRDEWALAFASPEAGTPHNDGRDGVWDELADIVAARLASPAATPDKVRRALTANSDLAEVVHRAWPILHATDIVGDLWSVPAFLRKCAPWLTDAEVNALQRADATAWTRSDLPILDAARHRLGDPEAASRRRSRSRALDSERRRMDRVVDDLLDARDFDDGEGLTSMLRHDDLRSALVDQDAATPEIADPLAGPFAHVIVDEAQELTDAHWQMLMRRCPAKSFTIVGDRAQARHGFRETWEQRLTGVGFDSVTRAVLSVNYRTPAEVMTVAGPVIRAAIPDIEVPTSIRQNGLPVRRGSIDELTTIVDDWLADHEEGTVCVIGAPAPPRARVSSLCPMDAKGLEFDLVVLAQPDRLGSGIEGAVDRYVAMTRTTQQLVILS